jgi:hypothetical protein
MKNERLATSEEYDLLSFEISISNALFKLLPDTSSNWG